MTRINVVPPVELCDQHLLAEHRELTRIPNCVARNRYNLAGAPDQYTLGKIMNSTGELHIMDRGMLGMHLAV